MTQIRTGGCQCGRIRYKAALENNEAYLCHCRMCQRATGGFAASFVEVPSTAVTWEHEPEWYQSSPIARRPFCSACGTPLGFAFVDGGGKMDITVGSFDDPSDFVPVIHSGAEHIYEAWLDTSELPRVRTDALESVTKRWKAVGQEVPE